MYRNRLAHMVRDTCLKSCTMGTRVAPADGGSDFVAQEVVGGGEA